MATERLKTALKEITQTGKDVMGIINYVQYDEGGGYVFGPFWEIDTLMKSQDEINDIMVAFQVALCRAEDILKGEEHE